MTKDEELRRLDDLVDGLLSRQRDLERQLEYERASHDADNRKNEATIRSLENNLRQIDQEIRKAENDKALLMR